MIIYIIISEIMCKSLNISELQIEIWNKFISGICIIF